MREKSVKLPYEIKPEGSLGLLALGDVGLQAWRAKRDEAAEIKNDKKT